MAVAESPISRDIPALERLVTAQPGNFSAHMELGGAYMDVSSWRHAAIAFGNAVSIDPHHPLARVSLGEALIGAGDGRRAIEVLAALPISDLVRYRDVCDAYLRLLFELRCYHRARDTAFSVLRRADLLSAHKLLSLLAQKCVAHVGQRGMRRAKSDVRLDFAGFGGVASQCRVRVFKERRYHAVVATLDKESFGVPFAGGCQPLIDAAVAAFRLGSRPVIWICHEEVTDFGAGQHFHFCTLSGSPPGVPTDGWRAVEREVVERVTGYWFSWYGR